MWEHPNSNLPQRYRGFEVIIERIRRFTPQEWVTVDNVTCYVYPMVGYEGSDEKPRNPWIQGWFSIIPVSQEMKENGFTMPLSRVWTRKPSVKEVEEYYNLLYS